MNHLRGKFPGSMRKFLLKTFQRQLQNFIWPAKRFLQSPLQLFVITLLLFSLIFLPLSGSEDFVNPKQKAVTYDLNGRLGNQLITYLCSKWIAHQYNLPLLYVPFPFADQFVFHEKEKFYRSDWESLFSHTIGPKEASEIPYLADSTLILLNFFSNKRMSKLSFWEFWDNPEFKTFARPLLQPRFSFKEIVLPEGRLNVLAHVRTGGGYDSEKTQLKYPSKFPPHHFYISAIETISEIFHHTQIYVYIMTDDLEPAKIANNYRKALSHLHNIEFGYQEGENGPSVHVLEDFFSLSKYDCLIQGNSTFSIAASLLGDFKVIITPKNCHVENQEVAVDEINIIFKDCKHRSKKI